MRGRFLLKLLAVCLVLAAAGCDSRPNADSGTTGAAPGKSGGQKRILLLTNGADPFWTAMYAGMQQASKDLKLPDAGLQVVMDVNDGTAQSQINKLKQYANQTDIAAVAVSVTDSASIQIARAMDDLQKTGVKVIAIDSDVDRKRSRGSRFAYLGTDNVLGGVELGKAAQGVKPEGGKYATFVGLKSAANAKERIRGFAEGAGDKFTQVENLGDEMDRAVAEKNVRDALDRNPDISVLVGIWAYNAHAIVEVVTQRKLRDQMTIVVFDAAPLAIQDLGKGKIDAMVVQDPYGMGYDGTRLMKALVEDDQATIKEMFPKWDPDAKQFTAPDGDIITTGLRVVHPDKGSPLKKEMFSSSTEFLSLSAFKKWLAEHNLEGS